MTFPTFSKAFMDELNAFCEAGSRKMAYPEHFMDFMAMAHPDARNLGKAASVECRQLMAAVELRHTLTIQLKPKYLTDIRHDQFRLGHYLSRYAHAHFDVSGEASNILGRLAPEVLRGGMIIATQPPVRNDARDLQSALRSMGDVYISHFGNNFQQFKPSTQFEDAWPDYEYREIDSPNTTDYRRPRGALAIPVHGQGLSAIPSPKLLGLLKRSQ